MRELLAVALLLAGSMAGCLDQGDDAGDPSWGPPETGPISSILPLGEEVLVSTPGHRVAEFMVARNPHDPDHLVTGFMDYDAPGGMLNCAFAVSFDGGTTWTLSDPVPGFSGPYLQFDPWIDFDAHGGVHAVCLRQAGPGSTTEAWMYYFRSGDGGQTWSEATYVPTEDPERSTDKSVLAVDRDGTVYVAASGLVARTTDNGTTWDPARQVESGFAVLNGMFEDRHGTVFLLGTQSGHVVVQRTHDGGETWNGTEVGPFVRPPGYNDQNRWVDQRPWITLPILAHDPIHDEVWVTFQSWNETYDGYRLHLYRSTDHGRSFQDVPVPEFTSPTCPDPCHITHPSIAFDLHGRIGMSVQLTRDGGHLKEVYFSASGDKGQTWLEPFALSRTDGLLEEGWTNPNAFVPSPSNVEGIAAGLTEDPTTAHNIAAGFALSTAVSELQMRWNGEYWGLAAGTDGFVAMWIDHRDDGKPQLWSRVLTLA